MQPLAYLLLLGPPALCCCIVISAHLLSAYVPAGPSVFVIQLIVMFAGALLPPSFWGFERELARIVGEQLDRRAGFGRASG